MIHRSSTPAQHAALALAQALEGTPGRLAIPGGSALEVLKALRQVVSPSTLRLTWADERLVPAADPESNRGAAQRQGLLDGVAAVLPLLEDGESPEAALVRWPDQLARDFGGGLDAVLLGLGPDGHVASLFPGRAEANADAPAVLVEDSPKPPPRRLSLTLRGLALAPCRVLYVSGQPKAAALQRVLDRDPSLPVSHLGVTHIFTDIQ